MLNIWFYANTGQTLFWLLSIVFVYVLLIWGAVQSYLFAMMVEMDQSPRLAVRNALFMALDNLGLTVGLLLVNVLVVVISILPGALLAGPGHDDRPQQRAQQGRGGGHHPLPRLGPDHHRGPGRRQGGRDGPEGRADSEEGGSPR